MRLSIRDLVVALVVVLAGRCGLQAATIGAPSYVIVSDSTNVNHDLSAMGTQDWQLYDDSLTASEEKAGGGSIGAVQTVYVSPCNTDVTHILRSAQTFTWNNGMPTQASTNYDPNDAGFVYGSGSAVGYYTNYEVYMFTPGDTLPHTVHLYGYLSSSADTSFQFSNSLAGATPQVYTSPTGGGDFDYSVTFQAANPTDALTVVWTFQKTGNSGTTRRLGINAATLDGNAMYSPVNWRVIADDTNFPTSDVIVAGVVIGDVINGTNTLPTDPTNQDCTAYFQAAMDWMSSQGGGTVFVPAGIYCFSNSLTVSSGVALRGRWVRPGPSQPVTGTIFKIYASQNVTNAPPFLSAGNADTLQDLAFWYPNQWATNWQYYPFTVSGNIQDVGELTLVNSYQGMDFPTASFTYLTDIYGCPLTTGLFIENGPALPRFFRVNYAPDYWRWSGLPGSPTNAADWTALTTNMLGNTNSVAISDGNTAGGNLEGFVISGYCYGIRRWLGGTINYHNCIVTNCTEALRSEDSSGTGCENCTFASTPTGIAYHHVGGQAAGMYACTLQGGTYAILDELGSKPLHTFNIKNSTVTGQLNINNDGSLNMIASTFTANTSSNIVLNNGVNGLMIIGGTNCGPANIVNHSSLNTSDPTQYYINTNQTLPQPSVLVPYPVNHPGWQRPLQRKLFNVMNYGAHGDGVADDAAAIQSAINAAQTNGGGVVFFPAANYLVGQPLSATNGVELRGVHDGLHADYSGATFYINTGANNTNAPALITLGDYCGIRGLNLRYVNQTWQNGVYIPYPYAIQCSGVSNYVRNILIGDCYQGIDFKGAHGGVADGCCLGGLVNTYKAEGGSTDCTIQYGGIKPLAFWPDGSANANDPNSISRTSISYIMADCTNVTINGTYTHNAHALVSVRGADLLNIQQVSGEQLQNGYFFESGGGRVNMQRATANVGRDDGTGAYDYWLQTNFTGSVTGLGNGASAECENDLLRVDNTNAQFTAYDAGFTAGKPLNAIKTAGKVTVVGGTVQNCTVEVPTGGQFFVAQSTLGAMPYAPQAGLMDWSTNCQPNAKNSFLAANLVNQTPIANGITVDTSNLASITANHTPSLGSTRDTNGDVFVGWHLANGGAGTGTASNNFNFTVQGRYFTTNGTWPTVSIEVYYLEDTDGTLAVYYRSSNGQMKLGQTYTLVATNAQWDDQSFTVTDAGFVTTNGVDIQLVASNCDPVVEFVAINSTNYLKVPPQLSSSTPPPLASFTATPTNGIRPLAVTFSDTSTGSITNLLWNFGDSQTTNTAAGVVVAHTYQTNGTFTVSLVASGSGGSNTNTQAGLVTVLMPNPPQISGLSSFSDNALVLQGSGGPTNGGYYYWLRSSTNLTLPLTNWSIVATNPFDVYGNFSNQISVTPGSPQTFYRMQMP